jgi:hypothetical protein
MIDWINNNSAFVIALSVIIFLVLFTVIFLILARHIMAGNKKINVLIDYILLEKTKDAKPAVRPAEVTEESKELKELKGQVDALSAAFNEAKQTGESAGKGKKSS